jgi:hypothetical protein
MFQETLLTFSPRDRMRTSENESERKSVDPEIMSGSSSRWGNEHCDIEHSKLID